MREIAGFGLPAGLASMAMVGYGNIDYLILGAKLSPAQVGFYYRAYTLGVQYETKISDIISRIAFPVYSRTEDLDHMRARALAGDPDQRGGDLPAAGALHRHRPAAGALALRPAVGAGRGAGPDPRGRRDGADDQQRNALAGARRRASLGPCSASTSAGSRPWPSVVFLAAPYGLNVVCVAVAAFQVITLIGSYRFMLARLVGLTVRQLVRDIGAGDRWRARSCSPPPFRSPADSRPRACRAP